MRQIPKGEFPSQVDSQSNHVVHLSFSNGKTSQRKPTTGGESNEGFSGGDDGEDPPHGKIEKYHVIDPPYKGRKSPKYSEEILLTRKLFGQPKEKPW